jgi:hypothetical protein
MILRNDGDKVLLGEERECFRMGGHDMKIRELPGQGDTEQQSKRWVWLNHEEVPC